MISFALVGFDTFHIYVLRYCSGASSHKTEQLYTTLPLYIGQYFDDGQAYDYEHNENNTQFVYLNIKQTLIL